MLYKYDFLVAFDLLWFHYKTQKCIKTLLWDPTLNTLTYLHVNPKDKKKLIVQPRF